MKKVKRSGKLIAVLLALLTCLAFSPWAMNPDKAAADSTDPTTVWNQTRSWIAQSYALCDITKVEVSGVSVKNYEWNGTTCDVVLDPATKKEAEFKLNITRSGFSSAGVKVNGKGTTATSISETVDLSGGTAQVTVQPYYSSNNGTLKTFDFSIEGGGQETLWNVTLGSGTGYTLSPVGDSVSPAANKGSYTFQLDIAEGYKKGADFAVKVNGTEVELDDNNQYTISNIIADQDVTVEDVVTSDTVNQYRIDLTETNGVTYTPVDGSESPVDEGNSFKFKVSLATGFLATDSFAVKDNGEAMTADSDDVYTISNIHTHHTITVTGVTQLASVTAPTGSTVAAGYESGEWTYHWYAPVITENKGNGTTVYWFNPVTSGKPFFRVQHPDGVTYWNFESMAAGKAYTVTMDDLTKNGSFASDTIYHDFHYNYLDLGDVYLTVNDRNYLQMSNGGTYSLNVFRNWEAINSFTNDEIALPDVHYEVVDINGNPSDLVSVTPDVNNSGKATIAANGSGSGMAVIKVTYDAMIHMDGYASGYGAGGEDSTRLGAIWPECTGVIVVTVGQSGSVAMGMTINTDLPMAHAGKAAGDKIDAEHDLLYYYGDEGASYTFKPETGSEVSIARCTLGSKDLSFHGFSTEGVTKDADGNVTVTGLTAGRHIVKVEKGGATNYQVLSARQITIAAKDADGNAIDDWETRYFAPGDHITFTLHNVNSPQEKLSQCYNNSFSVAYFGEDNKRFDYNNEGSHGYGQYNFSSLDQTAAGVIPEDWTEKKTFLIKGGVALAGFSGTAAGGHRAKSFGGASGMAEGTAGAGILARLPELTLHVDAKPYARKNLTNPVTKSVNTGETYSLDLSKVFADDNEDALTYKVSVNGADAAAADESYEFSTDTAGVYNLEFKANDGVYDSEDTYKVVLKVGQENTPPILKEGVDGTTAETIGQDGKLELNLGEIFEDADEDYLSYSVSVNGADSEPAAANYIYEPDAAGDFVLVFKANDGTVDSTDTYTVRLKVLEGTDPSVFWDNAKDGNGWVGRSATYCYVTKVSASGVRTKSFDWADAETCNIVLTSAAAKDATFDFTVTNYARNSSSAGVSINGTKSSGGSRTIQVQLENGTAAVSVQPYYSSYNGTLKTFHFSIAEGPANAAPVRKEGVNAEADAEIAEGEQFNLDLLSIFEDPDNDELTYNVSVNGADPVAADGNYTFTPEEAGSVTLVFKANDGKADSTDTYTVNLTVTHTHVWGEPEWIWADDFSTAKAKFTCSKVDSHVEEKDASVSSMKDSSGNRTYTAKVTFNGETYTDTKTKTIEETEASVDFTSQSSGGFLHAPKFGYEVSSKKAESYGYQDDVDDGVSALDVLVEAHELVFGDDFTSETAEGFLVMSSFGSPNMQFGIDMDEAYGGFYVNHALANDGTKFDDDNWSGTTVSTQKVKDGDLVEFFFYEDPNYGDTYNWFTDADGSYSRTFNAHVGSDLELTLKGFFAMQGSMFKDAEEMTSSDTPGEQGDVQLYTVDTASGKLTEIEGAVTDEDDGTVTLNFDEPGKYTITAYGTEDSMFKQVMSLTTINVTGHNPVEQEESKEATYSEGAYNCTVTKCTECGLELSRGEKTYTSDSLKKQAEDALADADTAMQTAAAAQGEADAANDAASAALRTAQDAINTVADYTGEAAREPAQAAVAAAADAQAAAKAAQEKAADAATAAAAAQEAAAAAQAAATTARAAAQTEDEITVATATVQAAASAVDAAGEAVVNAANAQTAADETAGVADTKAAEAAFASEMVELEIEAIMDEKTDAIVKFTKISPLVIEDAYTKASYDEYAAAEEVFLDLIDSDSVTVREVRTALYNVTMAFHNLVAKSQQTLNAATEDAATNYAALSKAAKTFNLVAVSGNAGKLSYSLAEGSSAGLSIDPETGAVTIAKGKNAGTYNAVITVDAAMTDDFSAASETVKAKITVAKVKQTMTVKANTKTVKAAKLKKAKQAVKGTITVKKAKGKVTYAKKSGSAKLTISKKGVVTVKKGTKKGTYKIKVNVKAAGNVNYKAAAKVVTVTVKVK